MIKNEFWKKLSGEKEMTSYTRYQIIDNDTKKSYNLDSKTFENFKLMVIGLENRFSVEVIRN